MAGGVISFMAVVTLSWVGMAPKPWWRALAWAYPISFFLAASAQDIKTNVNYLCNGERIIIENCNVRDLSDASSCLVGHPDAVAPNGLMKYTNETRGNLKKLLPTCQQPRRNDSARAGVGRPSGGSMSKHFENMAGALTGLLAPGMSRLDLKPGANTVTLEARNGVPMN
jgi:hypothetical protein